MDIFGKTKGTNLEKTIEQLAIGEATGGMMYYALAYIAKEKFGLSNVADEFIELGNQETNHGAFYATLNARYPYEEKTFWQLVRGLSKAEFKGEANANELAKKLEALGLDDAAKTVKVFALQEKHHGEVTQAIINKYAPEEFTNSSNMPVYACAVCGFEYVGEIDKEPENYKCPICSMPKTAFNIYQN